MSLRTELRAAGIDAWLAKVDLPAGQDWKSEIDKAVRTADAVLVLLSHNSTSKLAYFHKEIRTALDAAGRQPRSRPIIMPLRLEPCPVPGRLKHLQYLDLFDIDGVPRVIEELKKIRVATASASGGRPLMHAWKIGRSLAAVLVLLALPALGGSAADRPAAIGSQQPPPTRGIDPKPYAVAITVDMEEISAGNKAAEDNFLHSVNATLIDMHVSDRHVAVADTFVCSNGDLRSIRAAAVAQRLNQILRTRARSFAVARFKGYASLGCPDGGVKIEISYFSK